MIIIKMVLYILAFIAVLIGTYYCSRFIATMQSGACKSKHMKIEDKLILTKDNTIEIIKVGERHLMIGISNNNISILRELNEEDLVHDESISEYGEKVTLYPIVKNMTDHLIGWIRSVVSRIKKSKNTTEFIDILKEKQDIISNSYEENKHEE